MLDKSITRASWLIFTLVAIGTLTLFIVLDSESLERDFSYIRRSVLQQLILQNEIPYEQFPLSPEGGQFSRAPCTLPIVGFSYCRRVNWEQESNHVRQIREDYSDESIVAGLETIVAGLKRIRERYLLSEGKNPEQFVPFEIITNEPYEHYHFAAVKIDAKSDLEFWDLDNQFRMSNAPGVLDEVMRSAGRYGVTAPDLKSLYFSFRSKLETKVVNVPILGITIEQKSAFLVLAFLGMGMSLLLLNSLRFLLQADLSKRTEPWLLLDSATLHDSSGIIDRITRAAELVGTWLFHIVAAWAGTVLSLIAIVNYFPPRFSFVLDFWQSLGMSFGLISIGILSLLLSIKITECMGKLHLQSNAALYHAPEVIGLIAIVAGAGIGIINGLIGIYINDRRFSYDLRETDSYRTWALVAAFLLSLFILIIIGVGYYLIVKKTEGGRERAFVRKASMFWFSCTLVYVLACWLIGIESLPLFGFTAPIYGAYILKKKQLEIRDHEMNAAIHLAKDSND
jgi:hypothetical protein